MPASQPPSNEAATAPASARDEAVSEVMGQILMFGILSMVLVLSFLTFNIAKEEAQERVIDTTAGSLAQRISSLVIDTAIFAETFEDSEVDLESTVEMPEFIENESYTVEMDGTQIIVTVPETGATASSSLFAAGSGDIHVCSQDSFFGGPITIHVVRDTTPGDGTPEAPAACDPPASESDYYIYLEPVT